MLRLVVAMPCNAIFAQFPIFLSQCCSISMHHSSEVAGFVATKKTVHHSSKLMNGDFE
jgi:hypothetical protein